MGKEVILIFDVGKTNKKVLLFDRNLDLILEEETRFEEIVDEDGFPCDDAALLETWIRNTLRKFFHSKEFFIRGVNFATYGATLVYLDEKGKRLSPIYNYLKPLSGSWLQEFYKSQGGVDEFSRITASPALGMLNSGLQVLRLKREKPVLYKKVRFILHLPNYFSYLVTGQIYSEHTSIGCHTAMWDFDQMKYHPWLQNEGIQLPNPLSVSETIRIKDGRGSFETGLGIHDSSSSLAPYILTAREPFVLLSTGTWCISMNPFNADPLTGLELERDCLCFLGVNGKAVKSSRFFLGHIHDVNVRRLEVHYGVESGSYRHIIPFPGDLKALWSKGERPLHFFKDGMPEDYTDLGADLSLFGSFEEAYACLMADLTKVAVESVKLILPEKSPVKAIYITGGFSKNPFFTGFLTLAFPGRKVYISEVANATSLGAAMVIAGRVWPESPPLSDLGLKDVGIN